MTTAQVLARTLRAAGITRMFGLPGGEILDFMEAARAEGIQFLLTRHEATASLMADVTGQIQRTPGVCVATLGPGAVNMTLGVANAYLDRSPLIAITATLARGNLGIATHQDLDLNAVYRPFTKLAITLDGEDTEAKVRQAIAATMAPRMGPVHIALPSDVARAEDRVAGKATAAVSTWRIEPQLEQVLPALVGTIRSAKRPIVILGLDLNPRTDPPAVRRFVEALNVPVFVTPKAKGMLPEDHPLFYGVCAGVSGDAVVLGLFNKADLLIGVGFEPVESDKVWHHTMKMVSIGPISIATARFTPIVEAVGDVDTILRGVEASRPGPFAWTPDDRVQFRSELEGVLRPAGPTRGLSGYELTLKLRELCPHETIFTTDVGSVKMVTSQAWTCYEPLTFFESNGLSTMSYSFAAAMAARLQFPYRPVVCTIGDGGFGMTLSDLETCVREGIHFVTVVFNDSSLSLIDAAQVRRGYPTLGVRYGAIDFAAAAAGFGVWSRRVETMADLESAMREAQHLNSPAVIDVVVDPTEYHAHTKVNRAIG
jgi:acetolactate synthase-1/2/3 large subunit